LDLYRKRVRRLVTQFPVGAVYLCRALSVTAGPVRMMQLDQAPIGFIDLGAVSTGPKPQLRIGRWPPGHFRPTTAAAEFSEDE